LDHRGRRDALGRRDGDPPGAGAGGGFDARRDHPDGPRRERNPVLRLLSAGPTEQSDAPRNGRVWPTTSPSTLRRSARPTPYKIIFEANRCIGAGKCAEVSDNWSLDLSTGIASPEAYFVGEDDLEENVRAAEVCPAKKDRGVIHVIDRRTGEELAPDPEGDGTVSVEW
jgi:ferredoxin